MSTILRKPRITSYNVCYTKLLRGVGFKIALGIQFDFEMRKNYYFNTGLFWVPKRVGLKMENKEYEQKRIYKLQYIQIPFKFKLMTRNNFV